MNALSSCCSNTSLTPSPHLHPHPPTHADQLRASVKDESLENFPAAGGALASVPHLPHTFPTPPPTPSHTHRPAARVRQGRVPGKLSSSGRRVQHWDHDVSTTQHGVRGRLDREAKGAITTAVLHMVLGNSSSGKFFFFWEIQCHTDSGKFFFFWEIQFHTDSREICTHTRTTPHSMAFVDDWIEKLKVRLPRQSCTWLNLCEIQFHAGSRDMYSHAHTPRSIAFVNDWMEKLKVSVYQLGSLAHAHVHTCTRAHAHAHAHAHAMLLRPN
jgi:hypothetical protein